MTNSRRIVERSSRFLSCTSILRWARQLGAQMFFYGMKDIPLYGIGPRVSYNLAPRHLPGFSQDFLMVPNARNPARSSIMDLYTGRHRCNSWKFLPRDWTVPIRESAHIGPFILVAFDFEAQEFPTPFEGLHVTDLLLIDAWTHSRIILAMGRSYLRFLMCVLRPDLPKF